MLNIIEKFTVLKLHVGERFRSKLKKKKQNKTLDYEITDTKYN